MKCTEVRDRLDALIGQELSLEEERRLKDHLGSCSACRRELDAIESVRRAAAALPRAVEPRRDLWPGIEARLSPTGLAPRAPLWRRSAGLLAVAAIVAVVSSAVTLWLAGGVGGGGPQTTRAVSGPASAGAAPVALEAVRRDHARVRRELLAALDAHRSTLPPETLTVVERNLNIIDHAIGEIEDALDRHPGDPDLELLLADTYERETDLLRQVTTATARL